MKSEGFIVWKLLENTLDENTEMQLLLHQKDQI